MFSIFSIVYLYLFINYVDIKWTFEQILEPGYREQSTASIFPALRQQALYIAGSHLGVFFFFEEWFPRHKARVKYVAFNVPSWFSALVGFSVARLWHNIFN